MTPKIKTINCNGMDLYEEYSVEDPIIPMTVAGDYIKPVPQVISSSLQAPQSYPQGSYHNNTYIEQLVRERYNMYVQTYSEYMRLVPHSTFTYYDFVVEMIKAEMGNIDEEDISYFTITTFNKSTKR